MRKKILAGVPSLSWNHQATDVSVTDGTLRLAAPARTDWIADAATGALILSAPAVGFTAPEEYILSAQVRPAFADRFDAGVLVVYQDEKTWAKLCFEFSPQRQPMVVSVVTRGLSDDCNSVPIDQDWVELRVARTRSTFAFHYSLDGNYWHFVRLFALGDSDAVLSTGFLAQSPIGGGSHAEFSHVRYEERPLTEYRDGS